MHNKVTNISVVFKGIKKRARKANRHVEHLNTIHDNKHQVLTPEDFNAYERKAWELIDTLGYKNVTAGAIHVQHSDTDGGVMSVLPIELFPKQKQLIAR